jgi:uncharacterized membrane protein
MTAQQTLAGPVGGGAGRRVGYWWLLLSALATAVFAPLPYLTGSLATRAPTSEIAANYVDRATWLQAVFYAHVVFGGAALLLSPFQFAARIRRRAPRAHRIIGRVTLASIGVAALAGLTIAPANHAGPVGVAGFGLLAALWGTFALAAFRAIRRGDVASHWRWVVRTFALTYAAVTLRLWLGVLIAGQAAVFGVADDVAFDRAYLVVPFLAWVPNLLLAEWLLRRRVPPTG